MKAKKVYEFKRTRKQGLSKQTELGLNYYKKQEIEKWFEEYAPDVNYEIKDDLSVKIHNYADLVNKNITELPMDNLFSYDAIDLESNDIRKLPNILIVNEFLDLSNNKNLKELPQKLEVGSFLDLENTQITELPDNLIIYGHLYLNNLLISKLPKNLYVNGKLDIRGTNITELPDDLFVKEKIIKDF